MMLSVLSVLLGAFLIVCAVVYVLTKTAIYERGFRLAFFFIGSITPVVAVWALVKAIFVKPVPLPYREELARIEAEIEGERARLFGGTALKHSFSEKWKAAYLQSLAKTAEKVARHQHFGEAFSASHRSV